MERMDYALRGCCRELLGDSGPAFPSGSAGVAGGDCWLLMAVRGHLGDTPRPPNPSNGTGPGLPLFRPDTSPNGVLHAGCTWRSPLEMGCMGDSCRVRVGRRVVGKQGRGGPR